MPRLAYSIREFSDAAGFSERTAWRFVERGDVQVCRLGARVLIPADEAARFIADHTGTWTPANRGRHIRCETKAGVEA